jgi:predicted DNA-binding protein
MEQLIQTSYKLPPSLVRRLKQRALDTNRTIQETVRELLEAALKRK